MGFLRSFRGENMDGVVKISASCSGYTTWPVPQTKSLFFVVNIRTQISNWNNKIQGRFFFSKLKPFTLLNTSPRNLVLLIAKADIVCKILFIFFFKQHFIP